MVPQTSGSLTSPEISSFPARRIRSPTISLDREELDDTYHNQQSWLSQNMGEEQDQDDAISLEESIVGRESILKLTLRTLPSAIRSVITSPRQA